MVSNCTCASPACSNGCITDAGVCKNVSNSPKQRITSSGGGGTKSALPCLVPPIQFCVFLICPGYLCEPLLLVSNILCISQGNRIDKGKPFLTRSKPYVSASIYWDTSCTSLSDTFGFS